MIRKVDNKKWLITREIQTENKRLFSVLRFSSHWSLELVEKPSFVANPDILRARQNESDEEYSGISRSFHEAVAAVSRYSTGHRVLKYALVTNNSSGGFTLIETVVYVFILMIVLGSIVGLSYSIIQSSDQTLAKREVADNVAFMTQKVTWALRGAGAINSPTVGSSATSLSIDTASSSLNPAIFDVSASKFRLKTGSGTAIDLTTDAVTVSSVQFTTYAFSTLTKNTIRFEATVASVDSRWPSTASFDTFITVR